jgi:hypothetical protein
MTGLLAGTVASVSGNTEMLKMADIPENWMPPKHLHLTAEERTTLNIDFQPIRDERLACEIKIHGHLLRLPMTYVRAVFTHAEE